MSDSSLLDFIAGQFTVNIKIVLSSKIIQLQQIRFTVKSIPIHVCAIVKKYFCLCKSHSNPFMEPTSTEQSG